VSINNGAAGGPVDAGFSFEHNKESIDLSPGKNGILKNKGRRANGFLDSDSSISSPKH
jgi:hypothetical protein